MSLRRPLVLVVDDDSDIRALSGEVLRAAGFDVVEAASGVDALTWLEVADPLPDVVVLDVQMPDLDGWTTLARIRAGERTAGLSVILCTVKGRMEDRRRGRDLGADVYLAKPFPIDEFVMTIDELVRRPKGVVSGGCVRP